MDNNSLTKFKVIHKDFTYNGTKYNPNTLKKKSLELLTKKNSYENSIGLFLLEWLNDSIYIELKTSGSTGNPKTIHVLKEHMIQSALATGNYFKVLEKSKVLLCLPADYIAGKMMLVRALILGWHLDSITPSSSPLIDIEKNYDFCAMVPMQVQNSLKDLSKIKTLIVGGASISEELIIKLKKIKTKVYETYGMTETVSHIAVKLLNDANNIFTALDHVTLSTDHRNCLKINAPKVSESVVLTNDIVTLLTTKTFLWKGRFDNVINTGGIKVSPEQIEQKLKGLFNKRFFICGTADEKLGNQVTLIVESESKNIDFLKIIKQSNRLNDFECPKKIAYITKLIETRSGKIQRQKSQKFAVVLKKK